VKNWQPFSQWLNFILNIKATASYLYVAMHYVRREANSQVHYVPCNFIFILCNAYVFIIIVDLFALKVSSRAAVLSGPLQGLQHTLGPTMGLACCNPHRGPESSA